MGIPIDSDQHERTVIADAVAHCVAVVGGCGYVPLAPGTAGSAAGAVLFAGVTVALAASGVVGAAALSAHVAILIALSLLGVWAADRAEVRFGRHDDGRIVIDEVAGQWLSLLPMIAVGVRDGSGFFWTVVTGFVLFRVFDVWKPGAIRWVERRFDGGFGVMADDLVAGAHAALVLSFVLVTIEPGLLGGSGA